jgi:hypothetical protein
VVSNTWEIHHITNIPGTQPVAAGDDLTKLMQLEVKYGSSSGISMGKQAGLEKRQLWIENDCVVSTRELFKVYLKRFPFKIKIIEFSENNILTYRSCPMCKI